MAKPCKFRNDRQNCSYFLESCLLPTVLPRSCPTTNRKSNPSEENIVFKLFGGGNGNELLVQMICGFSPMCIVCLNPS